MSIWHYSCIYSFMDIFCLIIINLALGFLGISKGIRIKFYGYLSNIIERLDPYSEVKRGELFYADLQSLDQALIIGTITRPKTHNQYKNLTKIVTDSINELIQVSSLSRKIIQDFKSYIKIDIDIERMTTSKIVGGILQIMISFLIISVLLVSFVSIANLKISGVLIFIYLIIFGLGCLLTKYIFKSYTYRYFYFYKKIFNVFFKVKIAILTNKSIRTEVYFLQDILLKIKGDDSLSFTIKNLALYLDQFERVGGPILTEFDELSLEFFNCLKFREKDFDSKTTVIKFLCMTICILPLYFVFIFFMISNIALH